MSCNRMSRLSCLSACFIVLSSTGVASADEGGFSLSGGASSEEGATGDASGSAPDAGEASAGPLQHPIELGLFAGVIFPPKDHSLRDANFQKPYQDYQDVALELGLRGGLFPIPYLGVEGEAAIMPTKTEQRGNSANLYALRAHLVGQIPTRYVTPFLVIGGGALYTDSEELGKDSDRAFHFGIGAKVPLSNHLHLRLDVRDTISDKQESPNTQHWPEILLGLGFGFGGSKDEAPPPQVPVDSDGDGLADDVDQCPQEPANTPDGCPIPDSDGDGVLDPNDDCPNEAGTLPNGCPDLDSDGDGIPVPTDKCPDQKGVAPDGCPNLDEDGDGIPVPTDKCPTEPETVNGYQDADGCPDEVPESVKRFTGVIKGIQFDTGRAVINARSFALLDEAVQVLSDNASLRLAITGHTDSVGSQEKNITLSQQRADAVKAYFVEKGLDASRFETRGAGPDEPIADNKTAAGRQENRRIEFKILQ